MIGIFPKIFSIRLLNTINKQLLLEPDFLYFPYENIWFELIEYFFDLKLSSIKLDNFTLEMAEEKSWEKFIFNEE